MTVAALLTVAVAMTLLGGSLMVRAGAAAPRNDVVNRDDVSVYLEPLCGQAPPAGRCLTPEAQHAISQGLAAMPHVQSVVFVSQPESYTRFDELVGGQEILFEKPDLPASFAVQVNGPGRDGPVRTAAAKLPGVVSVGSTSPVDAAVLRFFHQVSTVALVVALLFGCLGAVMTYITMVVAAFTKRGETKIMQLVGASDGQVRTPFLLRGAAIGATSSVIAIVAMSLVTWLVGRSTTSRIWTPFGQWSTFWHAAPVVLIVGPVMAAVASLLALHRHLQN
jgi:cell division transport system permease protein